MTAKYCKILILALKLAVSNESNALLLAFIIKTMRYGFVGYFVTVAVADQPDECRSG